MPRAKSDIPVGTQFSPDLIDLESFLKVVVGRSGDQAAIQEAIWSTPVHLKPPHGVPSSRRRANLPLEAAAQYGLLTRSTYEATDFAKSLAMLPSSRLYEEFARHILLRCGGIRVVEALQQMRADRLTITADSLAQYLTDQGFRVTVHNTAINSLRMWLAKAGVISPKGWDIDDDAKERVLGLSDATIGILGSLDEEQRAFVKALCQVNPPDWHRASDIRDLAETISGLRLSRVSLPQKFLQPLESAGLIEYTTKGTAGGKSALLKTTARFNAEILDLFIAQAVKHLDKNLAAYYQERPEDIYSQLTSADSFLKGRALEAYAIHIMRLLGLRFVAWRRRARDTGGAEVDIMLEGVFGGAPTRWQVQCKNTPSGAIDSDHVAREVGIAVLSHPTHILMITNGRVTKDAQDYGTRISLESSLTVFLLGKADFDAIRKSPGVVGGILRERSADMLRLKTMRG